MYRRLFLVLASTSALAACANTSTNTNTTVSNLANDIALIAGGLQGVLPSIAAIHGLSASGLAKVNQAVADLQVLAREIGAVVDTTAAQSIVRQVETDVNAIITVVAALPSIPESVSLALQSASVLLPIIELAVGITVPQKVTARAAKTSLAPSQARNVLYDLSHH